MNCYANPVLHAGGELILIRDFDPGLALSILGDPTYKVSHFFAVPAPYQFMMNHPDFEKTDLSNLRIAGIGGAPCAEAILKTWSDRGVAMIQGWGMTETSPGGIGLPAEDAERKLGSAGKPLLHTEVKVVDDDGKELPWGEVGELYIKGPNITPGYWNNPEATKNSFEDGWLKTGDAARLMKRGLFILLIVGKICTSQEERMYIPLKLKMFFISYLNCRGSNNWCPGREVGRNWHRFYKLEGRRKPRRERDYSTLH